MALSWGIETFLVATVAHTHQTVAQAERALLDLGRACPEDVVVIATGNPPGRPGETNVMLIHKLGSSADTSCLPECH